MKLHDYILNEALTFFGSFEESLIGFFEDREVTDEKLEKIGALVSRAGDEELEMLYVVTDFEYSDFCEKLAETLIEDVQIILAE